MLAAGERALAVLRDAAIATAEPIVLDERPRLKPRVETARDVAARLRASGALPIAVGAGVINDVTKYAAGPAGIPYVCVATAASMDGYAASGAAMLDGGFKRTLACARAVAIVADLDVIAQAPARMAAWGYGDLAGKLVAGADWTLADAVGEDPLDPPSFALVQDQVKGWLGAAERIAARDLEALRGLVEGLLISGFAMQAHGNSRPASGSEHQIAHVWEMERLTVDGEPAAHGACVGVGDGGHARAATNGSSRRMSRRQSRDGRWRTRVRHARDRSASSTLRSPRLRSSKARAPRWARSSRAATGARRDCARSRKRGARCARDSRRRWFQPLMLERWLRSVRRGIAIRWISALRCRSSPPTVAVRGSIRRRHTVLDTLEDLGWLDRAVDAVFAADGYWGRRHSRPDPDDAVVLW